ncbi:MAG: hypothetical protein HOQ45_13015 [Nocardioidaceae bacterium]|nr:hypothetical protein [Nocardioidaceae bacterium]
MSRPDLLPGTARRVVWRLPAVLLGGLGVCVATVLVVVVAPGPGPIAALLAGVVLPAAAAPLFVVGNQLALDDELTARATAQAAWRFVPRAARLGGLASVPVAVALVAWQVWDRTGAVIWLLPAAVSAGVALLAVLLCLVLLPLAAQLDDLADRRAFWIAVELLARRPLPCLGSAVLAAAGVWLATAWSASVLPLVPGPVVVVLCAGVWTAALDLGVVRLEPAPTDG